MSEMNNDLNPPHVPTKREKIIKEIKSITLIVFLVLVFRSIFFEPFRIPTGSMIPSLMIGDFILVNKMAYGFKVPFSDWFGDPIYISYESSPKHGEVIVFKFPKDPSVNYIKRVIGIPGDVIEVRNKQVYVNGKAIPIRPIPAASYMQDMDDKFKFSNLKFFQANFDGVQHTYQVDDDNYYKIDFGPITIPKDKFFVMGDNRDFSYDSRAWGFVPKENIKGRAILVWFNMVLPFGEDEFKVRFHRIGTVIQ